MNLFEDKSYQLKDGRSITIKVTTDYEETRYGDDDEFELMEEMLDITAYLGSEVATAMYDELKRIGFNVKPSTSLVPDGEKFWAGRRKVTESTQSAQSIRRLLNVLEATAKSDGCTLTVQYQKIFPPRYSANGDRDMELYVADLRVKEAKRDRGIATSYMKELCKLADLWSLPLRLESIADDIGGIAQDQLNKFYISLGFVQNNSLKFSEIFTREPAN